MQNLPITTTTQPATPAQTPNPAGNDTVQATETFGNVLARQRASAGEPNTGTWNKGQPISFLPTISSTDSTNTAATGNEMEAPLPDVVSMLPGDMLAALLPAPANANSVAANEKPVSQALAPDGVSTLPSDMLAALLSTPMAVMQGASATARQQPTMADVRGGIQQQLIAAGSQGGAQQFASTESIGEQAATSLFRTQSKAAPAIAVTDTVQGNTFSTVLETLGKDAVNTARSVDTTQISAQDAPPDATASVSLTQSTVSPIAANQNGPVQTAVNTPVTHDAWSDEFSQKITWLATQHEQTAELHLNPPHLGPLDIVLNISGDQATALFTSPHAAVREAVEQALPKLREMLADNGITLGNTMVNDQSPKEQQAGLADKQRGGNASLFGKVSDAVPASVTVWPAHRHHGMVDTFV